MEMSVKQKVEEIRLSDNEFLLPLFEVIVNSLISIKNTSNKGRVEIHIERDKSQTRIDFDEDSNFCGFYPIKRIVIKDNGVGFNDDNYKSFNQAYSTYNASHGCKGVGRFTVLACFSKMHVESCYLDNDKFYKRVFSFDKIKEVNQPKCPALVDKQKENLTTVILEGYNSQFFKRSNVSTDVIIEKIIEHCLLFFLTANPPLLVITDDNFNSTDEIIINDQILSLIKYDRIMQTFKVGKEVFCLHILKEKNKKQNSIMFCANNRVVGKPINMSRIISGLDSAIKEEDEKYYITAYITGDLLDKRTNSIRNYIDIPNTTDEKRIDDTLTFDDINKVLATVIGNLYSEHIARIEEEKLQRIKDYILNPKSPRLEYKFLLHKPDAFKEIPSNFTTEKLEDYLHRVSYEYDKERKKRIKQIISKKNIDKTDFSEEFKNIMAEESKTNKERLANLILNRKMIIQLMRKFLYWNKNNEYKLEQDLHNIIFAMGADSDSIPYNNHNLWLLDERLSYHTYAASDKKPRTNRKNLKSESNLEPDLLIFDTPWAYYEDPNQIKSLVVFEFKRPGIEIPDKTDLADQIMKYFIQLNGGKVKDSRGVKMDIESTTPKFGYIICDVDKKLRNHNKEWCDFKETPYGTLFKHKPDQNLYIEVMSYKQMLDNAEARHQAFFQALGVNI